MRTCIFAGTFDPITIGHQSIIKKCLKKYGKVLVVIGSNAQKNTFFTDAERTELVKETFKDYSGITVVNYLDLKEEYKDYLLNNGARIYVRGIRNSKDRKFEKEMRKKNASLYPFIKTKFITCPKKYKGVSSSLVREQILKNQDFLTLVPQNIQTSIIKLIAKKLKKIN